jgi:hypothetical protein
MSSSSSIALHIINPHWYWCWWPWIYAVNNGISSLSALETYVQSQSINDISATIESVQADLGQATSGVADEFLAEILTQSSENSQYEAQGVGANTYSSMTSEAEAAFSPETSSQNLLQQAYFIMTNEEGASSFDDAN